MDNRLITLLCLVLFWQGTQARICKATPNTPTWPCAADWRALNDTINGRLLQPPPPAAVCHPSQQAFDAEICNATDWTDAATYANDPLGIINPNWSKDSCLPQPKYPCTGEGFPVYVVNASTSRDVSAAVEFAGKHSIRLNVKGSGHDYLGRSVAPNSLSVWTKHIRGISFHDSFRPQQCSSCATHAAMTVAAGEDWGDIYNAAHAHNLTFVGGTGDTIGLGGYLTGGGHSPLSARLGLAVDQVLEMEVVLPSGETVIANEVLNKDVFWAMRGGGGATFGIMTSVTVKTFPEMPVAAAGVLIAAPPNSEAFWDVTTYVISQAPYLQDRGVMSYTYIAPDYPYNGSRVGGILGTLVMPNGTMKELLEAVGPLQKRIAGIPDVTPQFSPIEYPSLYAWYQNTKNTAPIGDNSAVGNRLLDNKALSNVTALRAAIQKATPSGTLANLNVVAGPGLWAAKPAGGSDSVTPAWRKAYVEYAIPVSWPFRNATAKKIQTNLLTNVYMKALRELAPDSGSYLNEGDVNEPNFQDAYWGTNYPRLLSIKKNLDAHDVFWCAVCVGSEGWHEDDQGRLCRV